MENLARLPIYIFLVLSVNSDSLSVEWDGLACPKGATGQYPYALDCKRFYNCWKGRSMLSVCAPGTLFNPETLECDFPAKVKCYTHPSYSNIGETSNYEAFRDPVNPHIHHYHRDSTMGKQPQHVSPVFQHTHRTHHQHKRVPTYDQQSQHHLDDQLHNQEQAPLQNQHQRESRHKQGFLQHEINNFQHSSKYHEKADIPFFPDVKGEHQFENGEHFSGALARELQPPHKGDATTLDTSFNRNQSPSHNSHGDDSSLYHSPTITQPRDFHSNINAQPPVHSHGGVQSSVHHSHSSAHSPFYHSHHGNLPQTYDSKSQVYHSHGGVQPSGYHLQTGTQPLNYQSNTKAQPPVHQSYDGVQHSIHHSHGGVQPSVHHSHAGVQPSIHHSHGGVQHSIHQSHGGVQPSVHHSHAGVHHSIHHSHAGVQHSIHHSHAGVQPSIHHSHAGVQPSIHQSHSSAQSSFYHSHHGNLPQTYNSQTGAKPQVYNSHGGVQPPPHHSQIDVQSSVHPFNSGSLPASQNFPNLDTPGSYKGTELPSVKYPDYPSVFEPASYGVIEREKDSFPKVQQPSVPPFPELPDTYGETTFTDVQRISIAAGNINDKNSDDGSVQNERNYTESLTHNINLSSPNTFLPNEQNLPYPSMFNKQSNSGYDISSTNVPLNYLPSDSRGGYNPDKNPLRPLTTPHDFYKPLDQGVQTLTESDSTLQQFPEYEKCPSGFTGLLPHSQCNKFLSCANGRTYIMNCADGTRFNPELSMCDHSYKIDCLVSPVPFNNSIDQKNNENEYLEPAESHLVAHNDSFYTPKDLDVRMDNIEREYEIINVTTTKTPLLPQPDNPDSQELTGLFDVPSSDTWKIVVSVNQTVEQVTENVVKEKKPKKVSSQSSVSETPQSRDFSLHIPQNVLGMQIKNRQFVRLRGGPTQFQGYVEIKLNHTWGTMCDQKNQWTQTEANVVCKNLGYSRGAESSWQGRPASVTEKVSPIVAVDAINCIGYEESILECHLSKKPFCDVNNDAVWVRCHDNIRSQCRPGELSIGDKCYFVVEAPDETAYDFAGFTHGEALAHCQQHGGHLLNIASQIENDLLSEWLMSKYDLESVMTAGVGVLVMGMPIWIWESSEEPFTYHNWWPGWNGSKSVAPKLETGRASCIVLRRFYPCTDSDVKEDKLCDAQYYFWDIKDCGTMSLRMPYICKRPANKIGCIMGNGSNYRGGANVTSEGNLCLAWDSNEVEPFLKYKISDDDRRMTLSGHNYCRNVGGIDGEPWCFVKLRGDIHKEYCDIPVCTKERSEKSAKYSEYKCGLGQFSCEVKRQCIQQEWVCDGKPDCSNARDELDCLNSLMKFQHYPHTQLPGFDIETHVNTSLKSCSEKCLAIDNCRSFYHLEMTGECFLTDSNVGLSGNLTPNKIGWNYYERKSTMLRCTELYLCDNGKCLSPTSVCNGKNDCGDMSDERNCTWLEKGIQLRLFGGQNPNEGTVEIKANDQWGLICDDQFDIEDAHVLCRHLGFPQGALEIKKHSEFGKRPNITKYLIDELSCKGNESIITECEHNGWGVHDCGLDEAAGVICKLEDTECSFNYWLCDSKTECIPFSFLCDNVSDCSDGSDEIPSRCKSEIDVRLVGIGGESRSNKITEGRLEVRRFGVWGTVCDDDFGNNEAEVVCNSLGYPGSTIVYKDAAFGAGTGIIWLDQVHCLGNETNVADCMHESWGLTNCKHNEDVAIACSPQKINVDVNQNLDSFENEEEPSFSLEQILPQTCGIVSLDLGPVNNYKPKVVSGFETIKGSYPWQASVRVRSVLGQSTHWCGAVIISRFHVLTAGHCLRDYVKSSYFIRAGDFDIKVTEESEQDMELEGLWIHQDLDKGISLNNDIAIVKVKKPGFNLNKWVYPACLPLKSVSYNAGKNCTISGWGSSGVPGSGFARTLHATWLPIIPQDKCKTSYGRKTITDGMFCAGNLKGGADSCQGDSGGPIICQEEDGMTVYGITSWGHGCGRVESPGVYTNVSYYMEWIRNKIENSM